MSGHTCRCGNWVNLSGDFSDSERSLVTRETLAYLASRLDEGKLKDEFEFDDIYGTDCRHLLYCLHCSMIYAYADGGSAYDPYVRESERNAVEGNYRCTCGYSMEHLDSDHTLVMVNEKTMSAVSDIAENNHLTLPAQEFYRLIADTTFSVLMCPECFRFHIEMAKGIYTVYFCAETRKQKSERFLEGLTREGLDFLKKENLRVK